MITEDNSIKLESKFYGEKTILLSKTGYGKSYTARIMIEEGKKMGHSIIIIDPQDAYLNIPDFEYIYADDVKNAQGLGVLLSQTNRNIVIRMKKLSIQDQNKFLNNFLSAYRKNIRKGIQTIIIDEIHKYAPNQEGSQAKNTIRGMFQENRSDGLGIIGISQRISRVDTTILSQADNLCIGKVTSFRDKEAIKNYIDNPEDIDKIKNLKRGEFYFYGFDLDEPVIKKVRKSETKHSGESPKHLLTEDKVTYDRFKSKFVKKTMTDKIETSDETVKKIIPSAEGFMDLATLGVKLSLGGAVGGIAGNLLGARFASPLPVISSRTLGGGLTSIALFSGYRFVKNATLKDVLKYSSAGATAFTLGSLLFDIVGATGIKIPAMVSAALSIATGASPVSVGTTGQSGASVDLDTQFS